VRAYNLSLYFSDSLSSFNNRDQIVQRLKTPNKGKIQWITHIQSGYSDSVSLDTPLAENLPAGKSCSLLVRKGDANQEYNV